MKTRCLKRVGFLCVWWLLVSAVAPRTLAQLRPSLGLQFSTSQPTLSLTGEMGTVYLVQYANDFSPATLWVDRTLLQAGPDSVRWRDPSAETGRRFYRAVSVPAPADPNLVFIPPGTFTMGSPPYEPGRPDVEGPETLVTISRGFWLGKYEVTQGEYLAVMGSNPSYFNGDRTAEGGQNYGTDLSRPVENAHGFDATNYCGKLTEQERAAGRLPTNWVYRLPTEAEWEYACRAGTTTPFHYGKELRSGMANFDGHREYPPCGGSSEYCDNPSGTYLMRPTSVGSYAPNAWGIYDMHGNVWEWCQDWYAPSLPGGSVTDPQGPEPQTRRKRVRRGGGYFNWASACRSASRPDIAAGVWLAGTGFRVVLAVAQ